jgi:molybdopterin molybdotransferase
MRGFRARADVEAVQAWADALPAALRVEDVALDLAAGRVLARDLVSELDVPAFRRAAMDGWAVRAEDTFGAAETDPVALDLVGVALPGAAAEGSVGRGQAVRIMTGAPVPEGADAVLPAEDGHEREGRVEVRSGVTPGRHVGHVGEDVRRGATLLRAGRRLRPQDLGVAASVGRGLLPVVGGPLVGLVVTGDELLPPGARPTGCRIVDSNTPMLAALVGRDGGRLAFHGRIADDRERVAAALHGAPGDLLLVSGGSSVGQEDHAPRVVAEEGELAFHGVGLRPASPAGAGLLDGRPVFLLPGNPVSCLCAYDFFAGRLVRRLAGRPPQWPYAPREGVLARKVASVLGRVDYVRVAFRGEAIEPLMTRGASILSSTTEADGFLVVPRDREGWPEGTPVSAWSYDPAPAA